MEISEMLKEYGNIFTELCKYVQVQPGSEEVKQEVNFYTTIALLQVAAIIQQTQQLSLLTAAIDELSVTEIAAPLEEMVNTISIIPERLKHITQGLSEIDETLNKQ
jgi:hypothetical protein